MAPTPHSFTARDGYRLGGTLAPAQGAPRAALLVTSGTGFPERYYRGFCRAAAERGFTTLSFDARGMGVSAPQDLSSFDMAYSDWGRLDTPAAVDELAQHVPEGTPILHLGHSVGGHFVGLWDNHHRVAAHAFVCVGSGYWGHHRLPSKLQELYFWHVLGPRALKRHGHIPRAGGWTGEPLPRGVFETWRRWCAKPEYFTDEIGAHGELSAASFDDVRGRITSFIYTDDPIATPRTGRVILDLYTGARTDMIVATPRSHGVRRIGHKGPFGEPGSRAAQALLNWLEHQAHPAA